MTKSGDGWKDGILKAKKGRFSKKINYFRVVTYLIQNSFF